MHFVYEKGEVSFKAKILDLSQDHTLGFELSRILCLLLGFFLCVFLIIFFVLALVFKSKKAFQLLT